MLIAIDKETLGRIQGVKQLAIVPGATHCFEEPGALDEVGRLAGDWFAAHFAAHAPRISSAEGRA